MQKGPYNRVGFTGTGNSRDRGMNYDQLEATELYCSECGRAVPVRKSLLLVLPEGEKYEYCCQFCGGKVGDKIDRSVNFPGIIRP